MGYRLKISLSFSPWCATWHARHQLLHELVKRGHMYRRRVKESNIVPYRNRLMTLPDRHSYFTGDNSAGAPNSANLA